MPFCFEIENSKDMDTIPIILFPYANYKKIPRFRNDPERKIRKSVLAAI